MSTTNPFTLMFGKLPNEYIKRYKDSSQVMDAFKSVTPVSQVYLIEGIRGSGKTVLMTYIANELKKDENWIVIDLNSAKNLIDDCAMRLTDSYKKLPSYKSFSISIAGFGFGLGEKEGDSVSIINDILDDLKKQNKRVLITIDEVVCNNNMRQFANQFQIFIRNDCPIFLIMTGLYENIELLQNDKQLTFLLRTPKIKMEPLSISQITSQYSKIFEIDKNQAKTLALITKGYAFAFQALGYLYYEEYDIKSLDEILSDLDDILYDFAYKKIWEGLSENDKKVVIAVGDEMVKVKEICEKTGMPSNIFSTYRDRLKKRGILTAPSYGYISLNLPRFVCIIKSYVI